MIIISRSTSSSIISKSDTSQDTKNVNSKLPPKIRLKQIQENSSEKFEKAGKLRLKSLKDLMPLDENTTEKSNCKTSFETDDLEISHVETTTKTSDIIYDEQKIMEKTTENDAMKDEMPQYIEILEQPAGNRLRFR